MFERQAVLVPVPGSSVLSGKAWAAERLAFALQGIGFGVSVWTGAYRRFPVRKSATALNGHRPSVQLHYDSFGLRASSHYPEKIVLVDDVITKGRTILALAMRVHEELPNADIRAFALVRTMGLIADVSRLVDPCHGVVRWVRGDAEREP